MWFWIIIAVVAGLFAIFCIAGVIVGVVRAKKNPSATNMSAVETPNEHYNRLLEKRTEIMKQITAKRHVIVDQMSLINKRMFEISSQTHNILKDYITKYENDDTIDSDFSELLAIYKRRENSVNDEYLTALQKCKNKDLSETKEICKLNEERIRLKEEFKIVEAQADEWSDVANLKARTVWSNPECEELYNNLCALENDEIYKERKEKSKQWEDYSSRSVIAANSRLYNLGRNGDKIAIWDNDYNGQVVSIDDVMYFQVSEKSTTNTYTSSTGKPSKLGTAFNEMIFGTAAATASAMQKNQQNTTTYTNTSRKATIYFKYETGIEPLEVSINSEVDKLIAMMPEKQK